MPATQRSIVSKSSKPCWLLASLCHFAFGHWELDDLIHGLDSVSESFEDKKINLAGNSKAFVNACPNKCACYTPFEAHSEDGWTKVSPPANIQQFHDGQMWTKESMLHVYPRCRFLVDCSDIGLTILPTMPPITDCALVENNPGIGEAWRAQGLTAADKKKQLRAAFPRSLQVLDIFGLSMGNLPSGTFSGYAALRVLALEGNRLTQVPEDLFSPLAKLQYLDLSGNQAMPDDEEWAVHEAMANHLTTLPTELLTNNHDLRYLNLSNNKLTSVHPKTFAHNTELRLLALWGNPLLSEMKSPSAIHFQQLLKLSSLSYGDSEEDMTIKLEWFQGQPGKGKEL